MPLITIGKFTKDQIEADLKLPGGIHKTDIMSELKIDRVNLSDELVEQASRYAWWAVLTAQAEAVYEESKLNISITEAGLDKIIREDAVKSAKSATSATSATSAIKVTETQIHNIMISNDKWKEAKYKYLEAMKNFNILSGILSAWEARKYMLVALGSKSKRDYESELSINK